jgi:hypothetical protein
MSSKTTLSILTRKFKSLGIKKTGLKKMDNNLLLLKKINRHINFLLYKQNKLNQHTSRKLRKRNDISYIS